MISSCRNKSFQKNLFNETGFTLLEVLFAVTIVSIGLLAVASMQLSAIQGNRAGGNLSVATHLAEQELERLKSSAFNGPNLALGNHEDTNNPINANGVSGGTFTREWLVENHTAFSKRVTVTVSWNDLLQTRRVNLSTITRGGGF